MHTFLIGMSYPFRAIRLIAGQPALWRYIAIPIGLNLLVGFALYTTLLLAGFQAIETLLAGWPVWIAWLAQIVLVIALFIGLGYLLVRFGVVLGSPFYSRLSELLEERLLGVATTAPPANVANVLRDLSRAVLFEVKKLLLTLSIALPALLLNFIPGAGSILATIAGITLGATIACLDFFDPPLERRRLAFRAKLVFIRRHLPASAGFGLICLALVSIPLLNLLAVPVCITAGTLFFCEQARSLQVVTARQG
ncbi:EI24 domain-containing protein [Chloroflexus sp.]|uniref:EI24 domain-containing protein n=1 Tax=Chloroflexus sp. TaxID=1904827 RepID=UPI002627048D|nr:EI24 domain-containing protein [uncultured Chloroflexus sp.]